MPPIGKTRAPSPSRWATITSASVAQSAPIRASGSRLAVYWIDDVRHRRLLAHSIAIVATVQPTEKIGIGA